MPVYGATSILCTCKYGCSGMVVNPQQNPLLVRVNDCHDNNKSNIIIVLAGSGGGRIMPRRFTTTRAASSSGNKGKVIGVITATAALMLSMVMSTNTNAIELPILLRQPPQPQPETLSDIPQTLSSECSASAQGQKDCRKAPRIQRPKSKKAESCTGKCVTTCIRGGLGSPGEGPLNVRRPLVVFKEGFRSRQYCLVECSDICNLISDGDDGP